MFPKSTGGHGKLSFKFAILGLLADGPLHGYELKAGYESELVPTAHLNFGQVYTTLERLRRDGLVEFEKVNQAERPDKKVYSLTRDGRDQLKKWLRSSSAVGLDQRNETFLKLMLCKRLNGYDPLQTVASERHACIQRLHELTQARTQAENDGASSQSVLLLELAVFRLEAFLKWLDRCEEVLKQEGQR